MKAPLRPFEYMRWAKTVPRGARFDLTASGMADTASGDAEGFTDTISVASQCRRDVASDALEAFIRDVAQRYDVPPDRVTPSLGASLSITHVLMTLIRTGDHVIVERPTYEPLYRAPEIFGARVSRLERRFDEDWRVVPDRLARLLTSRTRAVILSNLHNPSGVAIDSATMRAIAGLAARVGALVLVDEVYLDYCFEPGGAREIAPAATVADNAISWSSTTKAFGFSSLRAGWIVCPDPELAKAIRAAADYLHVYVPVATAQLGSRVLARAPTLIARAKATAAAGKATVQDWLSREARVRWVPPSAAISSFLRLPDLMPDTQFAEHLRARYDTQVVPGTMFEAPGYVRLSFGIPPDALAQALGNFSAALDDLTR